MKYTTLALLIVSLSLPAAAQRLVSNYANAVAVSDSEILVGEPDNTYRSGTVYIYRKDADGKWSEHDRLTASDAALFDGFGSSLAIDGGRLLVGATRQNEGKGAVYVFERQDDEWTQVARLLADTQPDEGFGSAVALDGDVAVVGAPAATRYGNLTPARRAGAAYIFTKEGDGWRMESWLEGSDIGALFGHAVSVSGPRVFVGSPGQGDGTVYVYSSGSEPAVLTGGKNFGYSVVTRGERLFVGSPGSNVVSIYEEDAVGWSEVGTLEAPEGGGGYFGASIGVSRETVLTGVPFFAGHGALYQFNEDSTEILRSDAVPSGGMFGARIAFGDDFGVAAAPQGEGLEGTAIVFERKGDHWSEKALLRGDDVGLEPIVGTKTECREGKAALFDCRKVDLVAFLPVRAIGGGRGTRLNDLWGWTDPVTEKEYALVGRTDGTAFVDMSDPSNPIYLGSLPLTTGARPTTWRDLKVYKDHAFIVADGTPNHGMQIFDLTQLRNVGIAPVLFSETAIYDGLENAHNVAINEETGFAYTVGGDKCAGGLHMVDIRDPRKPTFAGCFAHPNTAYGGTGSTHDTQCVIYRGPDTEHHGREICFSSNGTALSIADVTDKAGPKAISIGSFPNYAYVHQGWLTEDQRYFYMNDELDEFVGNVDETRTLIWDLSDLEDPQLAAEYTFGQRAADHNLYIRGDLMYQSNYLSGLRIHDISDPVNPREVAFFDTVPAGDNNSRLDGSWSNYPYFESGVIPVSSKEEGLFLVKMSEEPGL